jgi:gliding motility-associated-like protein
VYKVVVTSEAGNCVIPSNAVIVQPGSGSAPSDPVIYNDGPFCEGSEITLSTDDVTNAVYNWEGPDGFTASSREVSIPDATAERAGSYTLVVNVLDCSSNPSSTIVDVITLPDFSISSAGPTDICESGSVQLSVANTAGYTYQWFRNSQVISAATSNVLNADQEGLYNVEVTQTSSTCSKLSNNSIDVNVLTLPIPIFNSPDIGCINLEILFENASIWDPDGIPLFSWDFGDGSPVVNDQDGRHTYLAAGTYDVTLTVDYTTVSCPAQVNKSINIQSEPFFEIVRSILDQERLCEGQVVSLTTIPEFPDYSWSTGETSSTIDVTTTGDYSVTVTDATGCTGTQTEFVEFLPNPVVTASAEVEEAIPGEGFQLEASGALNYLWTPQAVLDNPTLANPVATILQSTEFIVVGEDANRCQGSDTVFVNVIGENTIFVTPRKVFSPNGDGIDDLWIVEDIERYPESSIIIFTGNGSTVYEASPYYNDWNAVYNGKDLPEGAYFYIIRAENKNPRTGSVTVIR